MVGRGPQRPVFFWHFLSASPLAQPPRVGRVRTTALPQPQQPAPCAHSRQCGQDDDSVLTTSLVTFVYFFLFDGCQNTWQADQGYFKAWVPGVGWGWMGLPDPPSPIAGSVPLGPPTRPRVFPEFSTRNAEKFTPKLSLKKWVPGPPLGGARNGIWSPSIFNLNVPKCSRRCNLWMLAQLPRWFPEELGWMKLY